MLKKLEILNFRCFEQHLIEFNPTTIIVGKNNAGKSTIIEILRLISLINDKYQTAIYRDPPSWLDIPKIHKGISPSLKLKEMDLNQEAIFYRYGKPPAQLTAFFENNYKIKLYIGLDFKMHGVIFDSRNSPIRNKSQAKNINLPNIKILPQIFPLKIAEKILNANYIKKKQDSSLASLHFRNQINLFDKSYYKKFKELTEKYWTGLQIRDFYQDNTPSNNLNLIIRDGDFVAEIGRMGHGVQMWLQTIWFLSKLQKNTTVIMDEPDVYLHADLQKKLIRLTLNKYKQLILATHSTEIISEVDPEQILLIDKKQKKSLFVSSIPAVQKIINVIGGTYNIQLTRMWDSNRVLFVEGKDVNILKKLKDILFSDSKIPFDQIPYFSVGGWGGWQYVVGTSKVLKNVFGGKIEVYCLFDSDYHTEEDIKERLQNAQKKQIQLHIWKKKEIENYLIVPSIIQKIIIKSNKKNIPTIQEIEKEIGNIIESLKEEITSAYGDEYLKLDKRGGFRNAQCKAKKIINNAWKSLEGKISIVSGKELISKLSKWSQDNYNVSISVNTLLKFMEPKDIAVEVKDFIDSIENLKTL